MKQEQKNILIFFCIASGLVFALYTSVFPKKEEAPVPSSRVRVGEEVFQLEVADTAEKRKQGLGNRDELCARCAMLFLFEEAGEHGFWMKDMRFAIDIVWLREGKVIRIERSLPPDSQKIFYPGEPADQVLEFPAGLAGSLRMGDRVEFLP